MSIVVQKFGGTSVSTEENRAAAIAKVEAVLAEGKKPVVVVSAMGRRGAPYATDTLLSLISSEGDSEWLHDRDLLMSCGELISAAVFANELRARGYSAVALTGGQAGVITDKQYSRAECLSLRPERLQSLLEKNVIPVVTGFQGVTADGEITTLGRGGSDTSAALIGLELEAEKVEIYTDVDGIMTADPRFVKNAQILDEVTYNEVFQMAGQGANVIHPNAVEVAQRGGFPLIVRNTFSEAPGTVIHAGMAGRKPSHFGDVLTAVAQIRGRTQVKVLTEDDSVQSAFLDRLAEAGISVDLINLGTDSCIVTIDAADTNMASVIAEGMKVNFKVTTNCAKVSVIGTRIEGIPGVMSRVTRTLLKAGVKILQTADSNTTISCLVPGEQAEAAMVALHHEFGLDAPAKA